MTMPDKLWVTFRNSFTGSGYVATTIPNRYDTLYIRFDGIHDIVLKQMNDPKVQEKIRDLSEKFAEEIVHALTT